MVNGGHLLTSQELHSVLAKAIQDREQPGPQGPKVPGQLHAPWWKNVEHILSMWNGICWTIMEYCIETWYRNMVERYEHIRTLVGIESRNLGRNGERNGRELAEAGGKSWKITCKKQIDKTNAYWCVLIMFLTFGEVILSKSTHPKTLGCSSGFHRIRLGVMIGTGGGVICSRACFGCLAYLFFCCRQLRCWFNLPRHSRCFGKGVNMKHTNMM